MSKDHRSEDWVRGHFSGLARNWDSMSPGARQGAILDLIAWALDAKPNRWGRMEDPVWNWAADMMEEGCRKDREEATDDH